MVAVVEIDAMGLLCPLPVLRVGKRMRQMATGDIAVVSCDDPAALVDIPHFCAEQGHDLVRQEQEGERLEFHIRKG